MSNPQQPELRRSERGSTVEHGEQLRVNQDSADQRDRLPEHVTPEENRPGHVPEHVSDQPDLDRFAQRLGLDADGGDDEGDDQ